MCARITLRRGQLLVDFAVDGDSAFKTTGPRFNIAPSQNALVVRLNGKGNRVLSSVAWGLILSQTKGAPKFKPVNARCETAATSPMFRDALNRHRCLVPADGYYEWSGDSPPRQPYFIHFTDDRAFALAGLWERWQPDETSEPVDTFTILTTTPNAAIQPIHTRMPVIIKPEDYDRWLDRNVPASAVVDLMVPYESDEMEAYKVSSKVNKAANDDPSLIERV